MQRVTILDTTIIASAKTPGVRLRLPQKIKIARALEDLGVNLISTGFPGAHIEEQIAAREILAHTSRVGLSLNARCSKGDIHAASTCIQGCDRLQINLCSPVDDETIEHELGHTHKQSLDSMRHAVEIARRYFTNITFRVSNFAKADQSFLISVLQMLLDAKVQTITLHDGKGLMTPDLMYTSILQLYHRVPKLKEVVLGVEAENVYGLSVANSWAAIQAGANQISASVNGMGAGAGTASLAPLIAIMSDAKMVSSSVDPGRIQSVSTLVAFLTGREIPQNHPITGEFTQPKQRTTPHGGLFLNLQTAEAIINPQTHTRNLTEPKDLSDFLAERGYRVQSDAIDSMCQQLSKDARMGMKPSTEKVIRLVESLPSEQREALRPSS